MALEDNGEEKEQGFFPEMAPHKIPSIHKAALAFEDVHKERIRLSKKEKEKRESLVEAMEEEGVTIYEYGDLRVDITEKKNPNVRRTARDNGETEKPKKKAKAK